MAVIDCHHHVWWLDKFPHQFPPAWGQGLYRDFTPADLKTELDAAGIDGTILVQSLDQWEETPHYLDVADAHRFIRAVVGWVPLADPALCEKRLSEIASRRKFAGMRHLIVYEKDPRWLMQPAVQQSLDRFFRGKLVFEAITNTPEQMATVLDTARRMPDLSIVMNHLGRPPLPEQGWEPWASQMVEVAKCPNISVKLSVGGDVVWRWPWSTDAIRRYSDHCLQHFGSSRVMAGSNWPVVLLSGGFQQVWTGIKDLLAGLSPAERADVLGGSAERIYKL